MEGNKGKFREKKELKKEKKEGKVRKEKKETRSNKLLSWVRDIQIELEAKIEQAIASGLSNSDIKKIRFNQELVFDNLEIFLKKIKEKIVETTDIEKVSTLLREFNEVFNNLVSKEKRELYEIRTAVLLATESSPAEEVKQQSQEFIGLIDGLLAEAEIDNKKVEKVREIYAKFKGSALDAKFTYLGQHTLVNDKSLFTGEGEKIRDEDIEEIEEPEVKEEPIPLVDVKNKKVDTGADTIILPVDNVDVWEKDVMNKEKEKVEEIIKNNRGWIEELENKLSATDATKMDLSIRTKKATLEIFCQNFKTEQENLKQAFEKRQVNNFRQTTEKIKKLVQEADEIKKEVQDFFQEYEDIKSVTPELEPRVEKALAQIKEIEDWLIQAENDVQADVEHLDLAPILKERYKKQQGMIQDFKSYIKVFKDDLDKIQREKSGSEIADTAPRVAAMHTDFEKSKKEISRLKKVVVEAKEKDVEKKRVERIKRDEAKEIKKAEEKEQEADRKFREEEKQKAEKEVRKMKEVEDKEKLTGSKEYLRVLGDRLRVKQEEQVKLNKDIKEARESPFAIDSFSFTDSLRLLDGQVEEFGEKLLETEKMIENLKNSLIPPKMKFDNEEREKLENLYAEMDVLYEKLSADWNNFDSELRDLESGFDRNLGATRELFKTKICQNQLILEMLSHHPLFYHTAVKPNLVELTARLEKIKKSPGRLPKELHILSTELAQVEQQQKDEWPKINQAVENLINSYANKVSFMTADLQKMQADLNIGNEIVLAMGESLPEFIARLEEIKTNPVNKFNNIIKKFPEDVPEKLPVYLKKFDELKKEYEDWKKIFNPQQEIKTNANKSDLEQTLDDEAIVDIPPREILKMLSEDETDLLKEKLEQGDKNEFIKIIKAKIDEMAPHLSNGEEYTDENGLVHNEDEQGNIAKEAYEVMSEAMEEQFTRELLAEMNKKNPSAKAGFAGKILANIGLSAGVGMVAAGTGGLGVLIAGGVLIGGRIGGSAIMKSEFGKSLTDKASKKINGLFGKKENQADVEKRIREKVMDEFFDQNRLAVIVSNALREQTTKSWLKDRKKLVENIHTGKPELPSEQEDFLKTVQASEKEFVKNAFNYFNVSPEYSDASSKEKMVLAQAMALTTGLTFRNDMVAKRTVENIKQRAGETGKESWLLQKTKAVLKISKGEWVGGEKVAINAWALAVGGGVMMAVKKESAVARVVGAVVSGAAVGGSLEQMSRQSAEEKFYKGTNNILDETERQLINANYLLKLDKLQKIFDTINGLQANLDTGLVKDRLQQSRIKDLVYRARKKESEVAMKMENINDVLHDLGEKSEKNNRKISGEIKEKIKRLEKTIKNTRQPLWMFGGAVLGGLLGLLRSDVKEFLHDSNLDFLDKRFSAKIISDSSLDVSSRHIAVPPAFQEPFVSAEKYAPDDIINTADQHVASPVGAGVVEKVTPEGKIEKIANAHFATTNPYDTNTLSLSNMEEATESDSDEVDLSSDTVLRNDLLAHGSASDKQALKDIDTMIDSGKATEETEKILFDAQRDVLDEFEKNRKISDETKELIESYKKIFKNSP